MTGHVALQLGVVDDSGRPGVLLAMQVPCGALHWGEHAVCAGKDSISQWRRGPGDEERGLPCDHSGSRNLSAVALGGESATHLCIREWIPIRRPAPER